MTDPHPIDPSREGDEARWVEDALIVIDWHRDGLRECERRWLRWSGQDGSSVKQDDEGLDGSALQGSSSVHTGQD